MFFGVKHAVLLPLLAATAGTRIIPTNLGHILSHGTRALWQGHSHFHWGSLKSRESFQIQSNDKLGNLSTNRSLHIPEESQPILLVLNQRIALAISSQIHAPSQILHHFQVVNPEEINGLENNATQSPERYR